MIVAVFSNSNEVLIFALGPAPEYEVLGQEEYHDRDWEEYDVEIVKLPMRIGQPGGFIVEADQVDLVKTEKLTQVICARLVAP